MPKKAEGLHDLMQALAATGGHSFSVTDGDPWVIEEEDDVAEAATAAAEEYLVMGLRPLRSDGRPVRVADGRGVIRLFVLPWVLPAKTVGFGNHSHFVVTSARGVVGDWEPIAGGRSGVVVGVPETWVGILERYRRPGSELVFRCDVPVPWIGDSRPHQLGTHHHRGLRRPGERRPGRRRPHGGRNLGGPPAGRDDRGRRGAAGAHPGQRGRGRGRRTGPGSSRPRAPPTSPWAASRRPPSGVRVPSPGPRSGGARVEISAAQRHPHHRGVGPRAGRHHHAPGGPGCRGDQGRAAPGRLHPGDDLADRRGRVAHAPPHQPGQAQPGARPAHRRGGGSLPGAGRDGRRGGRGHAARRPGPPGAGVRRPGGRQPADRLLHHLGLRDDRALQGLPQPRHRL